MADFPQVVATAEPGHQASVSSYCSTTTSEIALRHFAQIAVDPTYPDEAVQQRLSGLVIAEICVPTGGGRPRVHVAFASHELLGRATADALGKWRFTPTDANKLNAAEMGGRIVYYFLNERDHPVIRNSTESFYVGPLFTQEPLLANSSSNY